MTTEYAENHATETARKRLAEEREYSDRTKAEAVERLKGKPTPTQEENDLSALGAHVLMHEHDGSVDPIAILKGQLEERHMEADRPAGSYQTRQSKPAAPRPPAPVTRPE
jgi:hypothetical protein